MTEHSRTEHPSRKDALITLITSGSSMLQFLDEEVLQQILSLTTGQRPSVVQQQQPNASPPPKPKGKRRGGVSLQSAVILPFMKTLRL
jgi:hypothetical protein